MKPGIFFHDHKVRFVVHSSANRMQLLLFDAADAEKPVREIEMNGPRDGLWQAEVQDAAPGLFYLYKTDAVPEQWLLDPYARAVHLPRAWGNSSGLVPGQRIRAGKFFPKGVLVDDSFDWGDTQRPRTPLEKTVIYEAHLRGFTCGGGGGSYLDFIGKIPYLKSLGVTAVEFLPLFEFNELEYFQAGGARQGLLNFWGYSTHSFFAPMSRYASLCEPGAAVAEFKTLVKALHEAGLEVILDVVFNHTAEGPFNGPVYNFRGLDESAYYLMGPGGSYINWSGCGNTFNANHPVAAQLIVDCLVYWAETMHVDGFRFDLATVMCRDSRGHYLEHPPVIRAIEAEPALKDVKLIAEAWDALGGYQVGSFPGARFSEWNGLFRDQIRRFWNDGETAGTLATRLAGSADLYENGNSSPLKSVNFVTAHDGFTLADLVTYERKHNEANCEKNRDGENHNYSKAFGREGPSADPELNTRRLRQQKNLLASLFLSRGVPMLPAGDEFGRTQQGNNNAYCQDNEISWIDWSLLETNRELYEFTQALIQLRAEHAVLHTGSFFSADEVVWTGPGGNPPDWDHGRALGMHVTGNDPLLLLFNNEERDLTFILPEGRWRLVLATDPDAAQPAPEDFSVQIPAASVSVYVRGNPPL